MIHAWSKTNYFVRILHDKVALSSDELVRLLLQEKLLDHIEEAMWVKVNKEGQELLICQESNDVIDEASPFERAQGASWKLFALHKEAYNPKKLVADVCSTVLNLKLYSTILHE